VLREGGGRREEVEGNTNYQGSVPSFWVAKKANPGLGETSLPAI